MNYLSKLVPTKELFLIIVVVDVTIINSLINLLIYFTQILRNRKAAWENTENEPCFVSTV